LTGKAPYKSGANLIFGGEFHRWPSKASIKVTGLSSSGMTTEAQAPSWARRLERTRSTFNDRLRDNEHVGVDFALRL
jgi:hypothetical protein